MVLPGLGEKRLISNPTYNKTEFFISVPAHVEYESDKVCGFVLSMGQGEAGQLGQGEEIMERKKPGLVKGLEGVEIVQIEAGGMHSLAVSKTGQESFTFALRLE